MKINAELLKMSEDMLQTIISNVGPQGLAIALNNVSCHGSCFDKADIVLDKNDVLLNKWFSGIEKLNSAAIDIEKHQ